MQETNFLFKNSVQNPEFIICNQFGGLREIGIPILKYNEEDSRLYIELKKNSKEKEINLGHVSNLYQVKLVGPLGVQLATRECRGTSENIRVFSCLTLDAKLYFKWLANYGLKDLLDY